MSFTIYLVRMGKTMFLYFNDGLRPCLTSSISEAQKYESRKDAETVAESFGGEIACFEIKELPL